MNRIFYNTMFRLLLPVFVLRLLWRGLRAPACLERWPERFGFVRRARANRTEKQWIWLHAVSVGETVAAAPVVHELRRRHPDYGIVLTTMTNTGADRARELFGDEVCHVYAPYDYSAGVKRFLAVFRPALVILMETELWPNLVYYSKMQGATVMVVNARLSERSFRGYEKFANLGKPMLQQLDCIAAQAPADARRFRQLGIAPEKVMVTGSLKVEAALPGALLRDNPLADRIEDERRIWIAASTREGEEEKVLAAFRQALRDIPELLLVLVPRHPERFDAVARLCQREGLPCVRRSSAEPVTVLTKVFLGDSMGEMQAYYRLAEVAFVGGSLVNTGCQNVLEPAALGLPVITGPSQFNFQALCDQLADAGALLRVPDEHELATSLVTLLQDDVRRTAMGKAGEEVLEASRGAVQRVLPLIERYL